MNLDHSTSTPAQSATPLLDTLQGYIQTQSATFHTPGHNRGQRIPERMETLVGVLPYQVDLPDLPGLNLFESDGVILQERRSAITQSQSLAAELFGAEHTWFLVNGSTVGILASILATCGAGDTIIVPRNAHQSVISGLILSGACPVFINPDYDPAWDLAYCMTPTSVAEALAQHPETRAVLMVSPTYHGVCGDVGAIATLAHQHNIPLIVDEAHGAHFAFHPALPTPALEAGADLVVQSTHKLLAALTQSSMLHLKGSRIDAARVSKLLQMLQSSSPSSLLLVSLDAARHQMAAQGQTLMHQTLQLAHHARAQIQKIVGLSILEPPQKRTGGFADFDLTRLTVDVSALGIDGFTADEILTHRFGVTAELPTLRQITFMISLGNTSKDVDSLIQGLKNLAQMYEPLIVSPSGFLSRSTEMLILSPREAFFAAHESVSTEQSVGRISAETICPYPPGIPLILPGEQITAAAIAQIRQIKAQGGLITGCADSDLQQIQVVRR